MLHVSLFFQKSIYPAFFFFSAWEWFQFLSLFNKFLKSSYIFVIPALHKAQTPFLQEVCVPHFMHLVIFLISNTSFRMDFSTSWIGFFNHRAMDISKR
jgi:hypothetical protein